MAVNDVLWHLKRDNTRLQAELAQLRTEKHGAYRERNQLVAFLASLYPSSLERHPDEDKDWKDDWRWVVYIDGPGGQMSWHIHDSELERFSHLPQLQGRKWDGHDTEEKYRRLLVARMAEQMRIEFR